MTKRYTRAYGTKERVLENVMLCRSKICHGPSVEGYEVVKDRKVLLFIFNRMDGN